MRILAITLWFRATGALCRARLRSPVVLHISVFVLWLEVLRSEQTSKYFSEVDIHSAFVSLIPANTYAAPFLQWALLQCFTCTTCALHALLQCFMCTEPSVLPALFQALDVHCSGALHALLQVLLPALINLTPGDCCLRIVPGPCCPPKVAGKHWKGCPCWLSPSCHVAGGQCALGLPCQEPSPLCWLHAMFLIMTCTKIHMATKTKLHKPVLLFLSL